MSRPRDPSHHDWVLFLTCLALIVTVSLQGDEIQELQTTVAELSDQAAAFQRARIKRALKRGGKTVAQYHMPAARERARAMVAA